jgi:integrase
MEISSKLAELIARTFDERRARGIVSPWLLEPQFNLPNPTKKQASNARYRVHTAMKKACALALLPSNLSTHSLRHTFATQHLTRGRTIEWVAAQMGDNPQVVWKTYAKWLKPKNSEAADDFTAQVEAAVANAGKVTKFAVRYRPLELGF